MLGKLAEFVQERDGSNSSMRLLMLVSCLGIVGVWGFVAIWQLTHVVEIAAYHVPDIPWNVVTYGLGIAGIKAYQKGKEAPITDSTATEVTTTEKTQTISREPQDPKVTK